MRIVRRWNQTGQKFAGDDDIVNTFLSEHSGSLWILLITAYVWPVALIRRSFWPRSRRGPLLAASCLSSLVAILFKVAFTMADSPELLQGIWVFDELAPVLNSLSLVWLARLVYVGLGSMLLCMGYQMKSLREGRLGGEAKGMQPLVLILLTQS